jgi:RNase adapter protein RapZ
VRVLFLEAGDEALVKRYEAARRAHPLSGRDRVVDGIARERKLLAEPRAEADLVIDTSDTNVHQLRDRLVDAFGEEADKAMVVNIVSFGFKNGTPRDADLVFDVRFLPNPHWVEDLRPYTGLDAPVRDYVMGQPETEEFLERLTHLLDLMVPAFVAEGSATSPSPSAAPAASTARSCSARSWPAGSRATGCRCRSTTATG